MPDHQHDSGISPGRVAFGAKPSTAARRSGAVSHRSNVPGESGRKMVGGANIRKTPSVARLPLPEQKHKMGLVHECVAFGAKPSKAKRRSGAGICPSDGHVARVHEVVNATEVRQPGRAVRLPKSRHPQSGTTED